jgi:MFS family permease
MVYPALIASVADHTHPAWRVQGLGVYRFWRDLGYAAGAVIAGLIADAFSLSAAIAAGGALTPRLRAARRPVDHWRPIRAPTARAPRHAGTITAPAGLRHRRRPADD